MSWLRWIVRNHVKGMKFIRDPLNYITTTLLLDLFVDNYQTGICSALIGATNANWTRRPSECRSTSAAAGTTIVVPAEAVAVFTVEAAAEDAVGIIASTTIMKADTSNAMEDTSNAMADTNSVTVDTSNAIVDTSSNVEATITGAASEEIGEIVEVAETLEMVPKTMASPGVDTTLDETGSVTNFWKFSQFVLFILFYNFIQHILYSHYFFLNYHYYT